MQNIWKQYKKIILMVALMSLVVILAVVFWSQRNFSLYSFQETELNASQHFGYLSNDKLYSYNGFMFTEHDILNNSTRTLQSGRWLPTPKSIHWADDQGVLLSFSGSFVNTDVERLLSLQNLTVNRATSSYTWYLNFKDNTLRLIAEMPAEIGWSAYSSRDKVIYFMPRNFSGDEVMPIYSLDTDSTQVVKVTDLAAQDISYLGECENNLQKLCVLGREISDARKKHVFMIDKIKGTTSTALSVQSDLYQTNDRDLFISIATDNNDTATGNLLDDVAPAAGKAILHNIRNQTDTEFDFDIDQGVAVAYIDQESGELLVVSNQMTVDDDVQQLRYRSGTLHGGKINSREYTFKNSHDKNASLDSIIVSNNSYSSIGHFLVTDQTGRQLLLTKEGGRTIETPGRANENVMFATLDKCVSQRERPKREYFEETSLLRVFFVDNNNLRPNLQSLSTCLRDNPKSFWGSTIKIGTLDPLNGRMTSN